MQEPAAPVTTQVFPPGDAVTVYDVGVPPLPALTVIVAEPSPATADGAGGVPGAALVGLTGSEDPDAPEVLVALVAVALKVYSVPLLRPLIVHEPAAPLTMQVFAGELSGYAVTVYDDGVPPLPALTVIVAEPSPATAVGAGGVPGAASSAIVETRLVAWFAMKSVPLALIAMLRG